MAIRNAAKAIIVDGDKMLVNKNLNTLGDMAYGMPNGQVYYDLPGGGQNQYETLEEAVVRECREETGYTVEVTRLAAVYEEISLNAEFRAKFEPYAHRVHFVFLCRLTDAPKVPLHDVDLDLIASEWVPLSEVLSLPLYPRTICAHIKGILSRSDTLFLGSERYE